MEKRAQLRNTGTTRDDDDAMHSSAPFFSQKMVVSPTSFRRRRQSHPLVDLGQLDISQEDSKPTYSNLLPIKQGTIADREKKEGYNGSDSQQRKNPLSLSPIQLLALFFTLATLATLPSIQLRTEPDGNSAQENSNGSSVDNTFKSTAEKCQEPPVNISDSYYKSQSGEDRKLMEWFGKICKGSYIEMGGLDGVRYSNSYVFNKAMGWKGVLIELTKHNYDRLVDNRKNEIATINAGVCDVPKKLHSYSRPGDGAVSAIWEFSSPSFREKWWRGKTLDSPNVTEIECDTLDELLMKYVPERTFFDFFSLDVEGAELAVLKSVDWRRVGFGIIFVEADGRNGLKDLAMRELIESQGYRYMMDYERSYWFVHGHFHEIYKDLIY